MKVPSAIACILLVMASSAAAQTPKSAMPKLSTSWGKVMNGGLALDRLIQIVDSSLTVKDDMGASLPVTGFRINYTFISTYKDQESGELKTTKEFRAMDVTDGSILPDLWKESIRDNAKPGDDIVINKILVRQKNGKKTMAPDLRLHVTDK